MTKSVSLCKLMIVFLKQKEIMKTCMFTGHRPQSLPFKFDESDERCKKLKILLSSIIRAQIENGVTHFLSGMALGIDCYAAEIVLELRKEYPAVTLEAVIPCANQSSKWNGQQVMRYNKILAQCDNKTILQQEYTPYCMAKRNRYMVDHSDYVIAVWNGKNSGTGATVRYAVMKNLPITILHPSTFVIDYL